MTTHTPTYFADLANFNADDFHGVITCADGLEQALVIELDSFGLAPQILRAGRVLVSLNLAKLYHICLFSRVASRVLLPLGEYHFKQKIDNGVEVLNEDVPEALYQFTARIDWTKLFGLEHRFAIRLSTDKRLTVNQQFATLRIKDAIADTFNRAFGARPDVDAKSPDFQIFAAANNKFAELFLDLSGTSLHRRGYRVANTAAPLKENLASALLYECGWHKSAFDAIIDPMCGSGTFITEALLMRANYPVGLDKASDEFGFYCWQHHDEDLWDEMVANAQNQFHDNLDKLQNSHLTVIAFDADAHAVQACHKNLMASGLSPVLHKVQLEQRSAAQLSGALEKITATKPLVITNPPYGERLGDSDFIKPLYHGVGLQVSAGLRTAGVSDAYMAVLASHIEHADTLPIIEPNTLRCHNGALTVYFRHGKLNLSPLPSLIRDYERRDVQIDDAQEFINRLQKNLANLKKQAVRQGVTNLRVYDADLPNFNVAIDVYGDKIHVQEYAPPKQIPADVAKARFNLVLHSVREVFGVARESIFIKTRARQSGNEQYTKNETTKRKKMWVAAEDGAYFYVNFTEYLDTGLFIDHRNMRGLVKSASRGKRVLNLFSYTCSASVHAALGGAKCVTSVDLSGNYLDWGKQNFALNGLVLDTIHEDELKYQFISEDTFEWIKNNTEQYDVIFIDPPTFSNSKKFKGTFDVQRDHVALINRAMNRLSAGGVLYFSNNYTRFELDESLTARYDVKNITHETIGFDFDIKKPIHQSFEIRHKNAIKTAQVDVHDGDDMPNGRNQAYQRADKADKKPFAKSLDKSSGRTSDKPFDKAFKPFDKSAKGDRKTFERGDKKHSGKKDLDKPNFVKPNKAAQGKPFGKSQSKQFGRADKTQAVDKPSIKRVYVNPKLADGERLAQSLTQKLNDKPSGDAQTTSRYRIKRKD
ncbi:bifunctional 23S rRNA (guanine(2069)-N(7))-methyltransferase RlmK/23S rRNA (guanine(2445)-N(2))-methyltransferase RlmL [Moraxella pluranimalium]|uniref:bifunctional 23S rRNA (guanine(2069)-N(7))-methyltransferase RlmK/23S rRNA (guanine(2445)-N(2))-methyltransferase RlmL n=1 Tax=Moraxella pluranimalium TaxID=470453 RepID=UPI00117EDB4A|nr:bifunctional 23S rRNA (guanine(2069)-N(7))-methyltransferase RlmK/23S rRNA (guanine(2445)-N(2))-methyltransferase RlmL [Moraxella pluranimalium]